MRVLSKDVHVVLPRCLSGNDGQHDWRSTGAIEGGSVGRRRLREALRNSRPD